MVSTELATIIGACYTDITLVINPIGYNQIFYSYLIPLLRILKLGFISSWVVCNNSLNTVGITVWLLNGQWL